MRKTSFRKKKSSFSCCGPPGRTVTLRARIGKIKTQVTTPGVFSNSCWLHVFGLRYPTPEEIEQGLARDFTIRVESADSPAVVTETLHIP